MTTVATDYDSARAALTRLIPIAMSDTGLLREAGLEKSFIGEFRDEALRGEVIEADLIRTGCGNEVALRGDGEGV